MIFLRACAALLVILMWGDLLYRFTATDNDLSPSPGRRAGLTWIWGSGLVSWLLFVGLWAGLSLNSTVTILSLLGGGLWVIRRGRKLVRNRDIFLGKGYEAKTLTPLPSVASPASGEGSRVSDGVRAVTSRLAFHPDGWQIALSLILLFQIGSIVWAAAVSPLTDWDAWVNWAGKANAIFLDQTLSPNVYNNPARLPTNMDYPLMLPLIETWFYTWLGHIHEPAIGLISLLFYLSLLLLFYDAARQLVRPTAALGFTVLLATIPRLERMGHNGMADVPLATVVLAAFLLMVYEYNKRLEQGIWPGIGPVALTAGWLPWLKNEGWLWLLLISFVWLGMSWQQVRRRHLSGRQAVLAGLWYALVALMIAGAWPSFLAINGTRRFTFLPLTLDNLVTNLDRLPAIAQAMAGRLLNPYWNFIWLFVGLAVLVRRARSLSGPVGWLLLPLIGYLVLISAAYMLSRFDPYLAHLNNSAERLILQATPLAVWWLVGQCVALGWVEGVEQKTGEEAV